MLARWVFTVWGAWLGALGLAAALTASGIWKTNPILAVGLAVLMFTAGLGLVIRATVRLLRGPRRDRALAGLLVGTAPFWFLAGHILMAMRPAFNLHVPPGWPSKVFSPLAQPLLDLEARWFYPERTTGKWVTMVGAKASDARALVAAMDQHVEASMARLDQSTTWPIVWYRGPILGLRQCAIYDMAIGSPVGLYQRGADGLTELDRHEVAHCVISRNYTARSDPPRVLMEGWAQANQGTPAEELADTAWDDREEGLSLTLRELVAPDWYWYSGPAAYKQGGPLVNYLLRVYGPERFLKLYTTCQQATFEADCRATLGIGLDELDAAFWADTEQIIRRAGPHARIWLKSLKLDPGVDPAAWDAFVADYFAAAARLVAPFDHVRLTTTFRDRATKDGGDDPDKYEEQRLTLLRSGPFARARFRYIARGAYEVATLAHPDHSLRAFRELTPKIESWTIRGDGQVTPLQAYRQALGQVESASDSWFFAATHGAAILLEYPQNLKEIGLSTDYEVVQFSATTVDGHRLVTLRLRTGPEVKGRDREDFTLVFDADDLFVVRSIHYGEPGQGLDSDLCFEYDHRDGRPVLRSFARTIPAQHRTIQLDVEECRFGPIPEAEFALKPFLASLGPVRPVRQPEVEPSTATWLDRYWLAFAGGGISLAGGSGLALGSRHRDRRALRAA
jgi:hypothetical protein